MELGAPLFLLKDGRHAQVQARSQRTMAQQGPALSWGCGSPGRGRACLFLPPALVCIRPAGWKLLAMLALFLAVMVWYSISREDRYIEL